MKIMISEDNAKELAESIKDKGIACVKYWGIETVPNSHIKMTYKVFPEELKNKKVHVFEGLSSTDEKIRYLKLVPNLSQNIGIDFGC
ncbi:hypothetical protein [Clostridium sp. OS1-26]|uniref:hypothetical protein n=1 Tax=Clostridium sp. OS1-26 TaxID=3070681 RepID=UPI0027E18EDF|nr:hypothetical protein [Clostridium sp. OS1-26]WML33225.1 hypothetical protein RCG18_17975 [Clostridium sp. OS1-26]